MLYIFYKILTGYKIQQSFAAKVKNTMTYKGYAARIEFDGQDRIFFGRLAGIRDIVTFHGETVDGLESAFKGAVDDYLATCAKLSPWYSMGFHKKAAVSHINIIHFYLEMAHIWCQFTNSISPGRQVLSNQASVGL